MKKNNEGFSLIELSIVLIIMGLLVAGITGGAALIKSAQLRSIITESNNQRAGYNTYYGQNDAVPGASSTDSLTIDTSKDAWDDLKEENIIDKKADTDGFLPSKFKRTYWYLRTQGTSDSSFANSNVMIACGKNSTGTTADAKVGTILDGKDAVSLLTKMDNGEGDSGSVYALTGDSTLLSGSGVESPQANTNYILMIKLDF